MSRVSQVLASISDPSLKAVIQEEAYKSIRTTLQAAKHLNPYAHPSETAEFLERQGIISDPYAVAAHTHAAAKCLELDLYASVSHYMPKENPVTFLFMKRAKLQYFRRGTQQGDVFVNTLFEPKDAARYPLDTICSAIPPIQTQMAFMGDTLHFLEPAFLTDLFDRSPHLNTLYATMVLPPEAKHKLRSLHPLVYTLQYLKDHFIYLPGGHAGASYCHTYSQLQWLDVGHIVSPSGNCITAQRIETKAANHLFVFIRGRLNTPPMRSFAPMRAYCTLPAIFLPTEFNSRTPYTKTFLQQMFLYLKSIKKPTETDLYAKFRQLTKTDDLQELDPKEITLVVNYFLLISRLDSVTCFDDILSGSALRRLLKPLICWMEKMRQTIFGREEFVRLMKALEWTDITFTEQVMAYHTGSTWERFLGGSFKALPLGNELGPGLPEELRAEVARYYGNALLTGLDETDPKAEAFALLCNNPHGTTLFAPHTTAPEEDITHRVLALKVPRGSPPPGFEGPSSAAQPEQEKEVDRPATPPEQEKQPEGQKMITRPVSTLEDALPWNKWTPILRGLGFQAREIQRSPHDNSVIMPITNIVSGLPISQIQGHELVMGVLEKLSRKPTPWTPCPLRARSYTSDIKNHRTGALLLKESATWKETQTLKAERLEKTVGLSVIHGCGGSGKSFAFQELLRQHPDVDLQVVLPTNELRLDWMAKAPKVRPEKIKTYERAFTGVSPPVVLFDDYGKLPAGYIEAYVAVQTRVELVILTGDARQSTHHENNEQAMISQLAPATEVFQPLCRYYINATHRNKRDLANKLEVYSEKEGETKITMGFQPIKDLHLLVPSLLKKSAYGEMGHKVSTYAGCQGITAPKIQILLDNDTVMCSKEVLYTALSRAVHSIHFINTGPTHSSFWEKLEATPYLKAFLSTVREEAIAAHQLPNADPRPDPEPKTHFPVENTSCALGAYMEKVPEKFEREIFTEDRGHTNCVQTQNPLVQLFPHQQAKDEALLWETIKARLTISSPEANWEEFYKKKDIGDILWLHYKKAMTLPEEPLPFSEDLWRLSAAEVQNTYLSKPMNMLKNGERRQSPDFEKHQILLFLKSQWVKKMEKLGGPKIKAGQTIASFQQHAVMLYGTMARYMRRFREALGPNHIKINCEATPKDLSRFIQNYWDFKPASYANDFTAFDQSQDGAMLQFEILKAKHFNIPEEIIQGYLDIKLNAKIFLGVLGIMRLTGEGPTFDANTECNIAYTHTRFDIPPGTAQLYAGDDSAIACVPPERPSFKLIAKSLALEAKPVYAPQVAGAWAEFCGYLITPKGLIKDPAKLFASLKLLQATSGSKKELVEAAGNYERDVGLAYALKDSLYEILSPEQAELHQETVRTLVKLTKGTYLATLE
uniref:RNA replication protein n=1 Tax=Hydrangea ringspot virus TaxID=112228 RepID=A0A8F8QR47_9VIRU|nr:replication-associated protein [Hydrangea ringspot virus]